MMNISKEMSGPDDLHIFANAQDGIWHRLMSSESKMDYIHLLVAYGTNIASRRWVWLAILMLVKYDLQTLLKHNTLALQIGELPELFWLHYLAHTMVVPRIQGEDLWSGGMLNSWHCRLMERSPWFSTPTGTIYTVFASACLSGRACLTVAMTEVQNRK